MLKKTSLPRSSNKGLIHWIANASKRITILFNINITKKIKI